MNRAPDARLEAAVRQHLMDQVAESRDIRPTAAPAGPPKAWLRISITALVVVTTAAASIYAIQLRQHARHAPAREAATAPTAHPSATFQGLITTATGTFTGAAAGTVRLTSRPDGGFTIEVDASSVDKPQIRHVELATTLQDLDCRTENDTDRSRVIDFGSSDLSRQVTLERAPIGNDYGDLSFMTVLALTPNNGAANSDYCTPAKMGVARLTWIRPDPYLALRAVDQGSAPAARGTVRSRNGRPETYEVAPEDQLSAVAARFDLTVDELLYLNPRRQQGADRTLYTDETLNLDTNNR